MNDIKTTRKFAVIGVSLALTAVAFAPASSSAIGSIAPGISESAPIIQQAEARTRSVSKHKSKAKKARDARVSKAIYSFLCFLPHCQYAY